MDSYKELFDAYFCEVNNLTELLAKYVNAYRLLIGGAGELNNIALARKKDVRNAIERANQLGEIIDVLLDVLESVECAYLDYIRLKSDIIALKTEKKLILTEIDNELLFQNSKREEFNAKKNNDEREKKKRKRRKTKKDFEKEFNKECKDCDVCDGECNDNEPVDPPYQEEPLDEFINKKDID
ncbi:hypothetical protein [Clostridium fallax]|uniref:Uncharacterized protein n=1 Tax=Clostridium fallax TaxID=1533 RepID=A0A1M4SSM1_9CLOT|nr:hypothetical protein [Clostridium fallax]SHE35178.1 hypothetical protein SAMN05443638_101153 [Clostridium fallax]SQB07950.1 Uncharacterised protein [Clostridium fallax]